jgi:heme exporter protein D
MTPWLLVWLAVASTTTVLLAAFLVALVRHGILLGRAAARMGEEAGGLAAEIGRESARASERASRLGLGDRRAPQR